MCGICGFTKANIGKSDKNLIKRLTTLLLHRGPDEEGYYIDGNVALGHRRLSIIDLAGGRQPMENDRYVIIFNGEIYNYQELRKELLAKGYELRTNSDTEVLLKMYEEYQEKSLNKLNGMFAFAVWDKKEKELFLARDRLGVKPLYYTFLNNDILFASEPKSIIAHPCFRKELNGKVLNSYFQYRYILGHETFFEGIYSLPPGSFLKFASETHTAGIEQYWSLPVFENKKDRGETYYKNKIKDLLIRSIQKRMISDVPLGAYLSGGLDSSIITAVMASLKKDSPVETFTIGFREEDFNEFKYARQVSRQWKTSHHQILLDARNYFEAMETLIEYKDAPLAVPNEVPLYLMSKELKKYITVVLSGEGADELFGGYGRIFQSYLEFRRLRKKSYLDFFLAKYNYVSNEDLQKFLSIDSMQKIQRGGYSHNIFQGYLDRIKKLDIKDKALYIFQNLHLQGLLQRLDTTTMAASVEGRVPYVDDHSLVEFVQRIPFEYKIRWKNKRAREKAIKKNLAVPDISEKLDIPKYILREAFREYLPKEILRRKKVGFPVPLDIWFRGNFNGYAEHILLDKKTLQRGLFDKDYLISRKFFRELSGINIWMMVNLELFLRKYFD